MFKNKNKVLALVIAVVMLMSMFALAISADPDPPPAGEPLEAGTPANPAQAAIGKQLVTPPGTLIPDEGFTFYFDVELVGFNGVVVNGEYDCEYDCEYVCECLDPSECDYECEHECVVVVAMPSPLAANPVEVRVTAENSVTAGGVTTFFADSADLLAGIEWPSTGIFRFRVTERPEFSPGLGWCGETDVEEYMNYSAAVYFLYVYVAQYICECESECEEDPCVCDLPCEFDGEYYVRYAYAIRTIGDDGEPSDDEKVDPTPGDGDERWTSDMVFTNIYTRTTHRDGNDNDDLNDNDFNDNDTNDRADGPLIINKTVTGEFGSRTLMFEFTITLELNEMFLPDNFFGRTPAIPAEYDEFDNLITPAVPANPGYFLGFIFNADGVIQEAVRVPVNGTATFELAHGWHIAFQNTPVGTQYRVIETVVTGYDTEIEITIEGGETVTVEGVDTGDRLVVDHIFVPVLDGDGDPIEDEYEIYRIQTEVAYTNDFDREPPTGLNLQNGSVIALIVLTIGALAAFVVVKANKAKN